MNNPMLGIAFFVISLMLCSLMIPSLLLWRDEIREEKRKAAQTTPEA